MTQFFKALLPLFLLSLTAPRVVQGVILVSEIANQGSSGVCNGEDWVELYNSGTAAVDLGQGYIIYDSQGLNSADAFRFPFGTSIAANDYLLLCTRLNPGQPNGTLSPQFGVGGDDSIFLARIEGTSVEIFSAVGPLPGTSVDAGNLATLDITYALDLATREYNYTSTPTPGEANIMTPVPTQAEIIAELKARFAAQNAEGEAFFNFDTKGDPVPNGMDPILDLKITMAPNEYDLLLENPHFQEYLPFQTATVMTKGGEELINLATPGRIRTRGTDGVFLAACVGSPLPFRLDFDSEDVSQTLFGVQRILLRHPLRDASHMREWAYHRMLARFGLPHARTRMVHFYINDELQGFYTLMELPEQEYVFARNFPDYNPNNYALFQTEPLTKHCGYYPNVLLEQATDRVDEASTPPYQFERGQHTLPIERLGPNSLEECKDRYNDYFNGPLLSDAALAYVRNDDNCAAMFLDEGLVDQELGTNNWDNEIENFIQQVMGFGRCIPDCANSVFAQEVDQTNFLKTFAFLSVVLGIDSVMGNVNNHYLAQADSDQELWKLVVYDFANPTPSACDSSVCAERLVHWSIARPTCNSLEANPLVGPLLTDEALHSQYLGYAGAFLENVYANETVIAEIEAHAEAIEEAVKDAFGSGDGFDDELIANADNWNSNTIPLLPTMAARAADLRDQLAAIENGQFGRGPHVGNSENLAWEVCADWRADQANTTACEEGCNYEGCFMSGWTVESFCDEATGTCYHGQEDQQCIGIADGDPFPGSTEGRGQPFCWYAKGVPVRAAECLGVGEVPIGDGSTADGDESSSTSVRSNLVSTLWLFLASLILQTVLSKYQ